MDKSLIGAPKSPPLSCLDLDNNEFGRELVVLETIIPSMDVSKITEATSDISSNIKSGASLTNSGACGAQVSRAWRAEVRRCERDWWRWRKRRPGVLGEETLMTR